MNLDLGARPAPDGVDVAASSPKECADVHLGQRYRICHLDETKDKRKRRAEKETYF